LSERTELDLFITNKEEVNGKIEKNNHKNGEHLRRPHDWREKTSRVEEGGPGNVV